MNEEDINTKDIDSNGIVQGYAIETHFKPVEHIYRNDGEGFVRVVFDDGATNGETRIPIEILKELARILLK